MIQIALDRAKSLTIIPWEIVGFSQYSFGLKFSCSNDQVFDVQYIADLLFLTLIINIKIKNMLQLVSKIQSFQLIYLLLVTFNKIKMKLRIAVTQLGEHKQIDNRWSQIKMINPFSARQAFAFCAQVDMGYLHGGYNSDDGILSDMYMAKFNQPEERQWYLVQQKGKQIPGKLRYHTLTSYLYFLVCLGGQRSQIQGNQNIYIYNLKTKIWAKSNIVSENPEIKQEQIRALISRDSHSCTLYKKYLYVFGGYLVNKGEYSNSMIRINLQKLETTLQVSVKVLKFNQLQIPLPRANFASCSLKQSLYIFGGTNSEQFFNDLWRFDFQNEKWLNLTISSSYWPQKRKGAVIVPHLQSQCLILFGGMQNVTKQKNDLSIYQIKKNQWIKIHSFTNNIYDPSPTIKQQVQNSPTMIYHRGKKHEQRPQSKTTFKIGLVNASSHKGQIKYFTSKKDKDSKSTTKSDFNNKACKTQMSFTRPNQDQFGLTGGILKKKTELKMSVVQQKKHRQFLARKKKLLSEIYRGYQTEKTKRPFSPISQCLNYTITQLGQQHQFNESKNPEFHLPKVIFDEKKSMVIGKKPCARDGHAAFSVGQNMYIIGGDRHNVSFNDTHLLRMDKAIQSLKYYT